MAEDLIYPLKRSKMIHERNRQSNHNEKSYSDRDNWWRTAWKNDCPRSQAHVF
jgi:hypothetical protein